MHLSPRRIDLYYFVQNSRVDTIPLPEFFRGADNELFFLVDNPADVVGDPSGRKGSVGTTLEDDDIQLGSATPRLGGGAHPRGIAADDDKFFFGHDSYSRMFLRNCLTGLLLKRPQERHKVLLFLVAQPGLKNQVEELYGIFQREQPVIVQVRR